MPNEGRSSDVVVKVGELECVLPDISSGARAGGFIFGLYKAGSTMLFTAVKSLASVAGTPYFDVGQHFRTANVVLETARIDEAGQGTLFSYLSRPGVIFGGWRQFPTNYALPIDRDTRAYLLVRDPRDMITSQYFSLKYSHTTEGPGGSNIRRARDRLENIGIDSFALAQAPKIKRYFDDYKKIADARLKIHRYEDIIFHKSSFLNELCDHLGLHVPRDHLNSILQRIDLRPREENVHSHVRNVAPGDHVNKLSSSTIEELNACLHDVLAEYDYSLTS
jgi:hypothetical protein